MPSVCVGEQNGIDCGERMTVPVDGGKMEKEWETGTSIIEQLVPEIRMHALTFLDYPSLCGLSMTNSLLHRAANDESVWKALYLKDFSLEQGNVKPANGWKAYYAATVAIVKCNAEFYRIVKERSHSAISQFWHNAGYVKCFHANGKSFTGISKSLEFCARAWFDKRGENPHHQTESLENCLLQASNPKNRRKQQHAED
ncbi:probable F-box protein At4g23960 isoform X5 [Salvia miltiorrhiza]|uniref:probable F-box protein At4g23960 isoform X5 n=1 Tax=Salvia miltiorrhiza TaxID=226208 RepID=UPI0025AC5131|nr:probable F-box protein At4g23960 isoform X5 [Salvia miltiorrhiza]